MTGAPYAAYARVRAVTQKGTAAGAAGYGFNIRWQNVPKQTTSYPGLARWTPVEGATSYQVWFTGHQPRRRDPRQRRRPARVLRVPPGRELHAARSTGASGPSAGSPSCRASSLPSTTGRGAQPFTSTNPAMDDGSSARARGRTRSRRARRRSPKAHEMTPAFVFAGSRDAVRQHVRPLSGSTSSATSSASTRLPRRHRRRPRLCRAEQGHDQAADRREGRRRRREPRSSTLGDEGQTYTARGIALQAGERGRTPATGGRRSRHRRTSGSGTRPAPPVEQASNSTGRRSSSSRAAGRTDGSTGRSSRSKLVPKLEPDGKIVGYSTSTPSCRRTPAPPDASSPSARHRPRSSPARARAYASRALAARDA